MKVFISWSGEKSLKVALILRDWLKSVIQTLEPFVSSEDIEKGEMGGHRLTEELRSTDFGILCLTRDNALRPWVNFEAGALWKGTERSRMATYLIDLPSSEVKQPLALFQWTESSKKDDTLRLLRDLNVAQGDRKLPDASVEKAFEKWWPDLEAALKPIRSGDTAKKSQRTQEDILTEILTLVRQIVRAEADDSVKVADERYQRAWTALRSFGAPDASTLLTGEAELPRWLSERDRDFIERHASAIMSLPPTSERDKVLATLAARSRVARQASLMREPAPAKKTDEDESK